MLPSLGRAGSDFDALATALADGGFERIPYEPATSGATLHDLAAHAADAIGDEPAHVIGHAFGQRVSRCLAADRPDLVRSLVLLACGGSVQPPREAHEALLRCFDPSLPDDEHLETVRFAFFADGNDPMPFRDGWDGALAAVQGAAVRATPTDDWWLGGSAPILVLQGMHDRIAPPANAYQLRDQAPERVQVIVIESAGHAMLPEQPDAIAAHALEYLTAH